MKPFFLLLVFIPSIAICQIDIMQQSDEAYIKPRQYDSLYNYNISPSWDIREIIGQKITFLPFSSKGQKGISQLNVCECYVEKPIILRTTQSYEDAANEASALKGFDEVQQHTKNNNVGLLSLFDKKEKKHDYNKELNDPKNLTGKDSMAVYNYKPIFLPKQRGVQRGGDVYLTDPAAVANKTFIITDVIDNTQNDGRRKIRLPYHYKFDVIFKLKSQENGDSMILGVQEVREHAHGPLGVGSFVVNGYYTKLKNLYTGRKFYARKKTDEILLTVNNETTNLLTDAFTGEKITIDSTNQGWVCDKVTFVENSWDLYPTLSLLLKNGTKSFALDVSEQEGDIANSEYFKTEKEYAYEKMLVAERQRREREDKEAAQKQVIEDSLNLDKIHKDNLAKYGGRIGRLINDGKVVVGMNEDECTKAWGNPYDINTTTTASNTYEQWVYGA